MEVLDQVCMDLPAAVADQEIAFWARLTGWEWSATSPPEFGFLRRPDGMPVRILTQRLVESKGSVRGHVDFACASRTVSLARHLAAGATVESDHAFWTVPVSYTHLDVYKRQAWRGAAPVHRAVMAGDEVTGATTFRLEAGLDTGPVYGTMTELVRPRDTAGDLLERLSVAGACLLYTSRCV